MKNVVSALWGAFLCGLVLAGYQTPSHAQNAIQALVTATCGTPGITLTAGKNGPVFQDNTGKLCVNAAVTATVSVTGFQPGGAFATLTATGSSASVALPAGTVIAFQNTGTTTVSCTLGIGSATASASQNIIPAGSTLFLTVGSNTFGACIDQTGSTSNVVALSGGAGLGTGFGGGGAGGGGGGAVTIADGADVTLGAIADAASTAGGTGTLSAKLRLMTTQLGTINTTLGSPFQAGGSIGNTTFAVTNAGTFAVQLSGATNNINNIAGTISLPTGASTSANQSTEIASLATIATNTGAAIPAGTALIGKVGFDQTTPGTTNGVQVNAALPAGTNTIGTVGQLTYPVGATPLTASATGTTAATTATLAGTTGKTTYVCGYSIRANATANTNVTNTLTGVISGTMSSIMWVPANTAGLGVDEQIFSPCIPASTTNTGIAAVSGAPGTGGLVSSKIWGYQL